MWNRQTIVYARVRSLIRGELDFNKQRASQTEFISLLSEANDMGLPAHGVDMIIEHEAPAEATGKRLFPEHLEKFENW